MPLSQTVSVLKEQISVHIMTLIVSVHIIKLTNP